MLVVASVAVRTVAVAEPFNSVAVRFLRGDLSPPVRNLIALDPLLSWAPPYFNWGSCFGEGLSLPQGVLLSWAYLAATAACA